MNYKKVNDEAVIVTYKRSCDCADDATKFMFPCDISSTGTPICSECGSDYDYDCVKLSVPNVVLITTTIASKL
jgi:hypothetical protein